MVILRKGIHHGFRNDPLRSNHSIHKSVTGGFEHPMSRNRAFKHPYSIANSGRAQNLRDFAHALYLFFSFHATRLFVTVTTAAAGSS